ncbi:MAG: VPLPA-CTERM-specific exosortase XrtD [Methylococcales bacterium]|nr:VPLPA-CTERM-specific exosortase XrtD [Methylococcales bacterium]
MVALNKKSLLILSSCVIGICLLLIFDKGLVFTVEQWERDEYSHGYLIPFISGWLVWESRATLAKLTHTGSWGGLAVVVLGLILGLMGKLSSLFIITQYAFLMVLSGLCVAFWGRGVMRILWFPLTYLDFMIPVPPFLYNNLSSNLQLISSDLGVAIIRLFDISVHLEGNVIDLGAYQLQVVEACSGLRYLFPLASFGFLCAYFFRAPFWMRTVIFLSTVPITILMNSFRIAMIGILVDNFGIAQAEGFLHDFEGWVIFIGCLALLFVEMWLLTRWFIKHKQFSDVFVVGISIPDLPVQLPSNKHVMGMSLGLPASYAACCGLLLVASTFSLYLDDRQDLSPSRRHFVNFPLQINEWKGIEVGMEQKYIDTLQFDDYIIANYARLTDTAPVNFYVAYYSSQRQGASVHSPKSCLPGDGWLMGDFEQKVIPSVTMPNGQPLMVNRVVISKGDAKQLVYYWFQQRGRIITNEYLAKWFLFWDALTRKRTDGALVRLVIPLNETQTVVQGDQTLDAFIQAGIPLLPDYVPN